MMGIKERDFQRLPDDLSLEVLVPKDNFYRWLEERIDLSFVRELVRPLYAGGGRRSIDPVVFFKLQLVMFFEDLRSERQLMEAVADRLSLRWYLGYDLHESLPDHSSLTRIRERYGLEIFRRFFERIVGMCVEAGLVRGEELFFDATKVEADAAVDSLAPRWFVEGHLRDLFEEDGAEHEKGAEDVWDAEPKDEEPVYIACPRRKTRTSSESNRGPATGSRAAAPRIAPSRGPPGASGPPTPWPRRPIPTPPR
jgi:transposase